MCRQLLLASWDLKYAGFKCSHMQVMTAREHADKQQASTPTSVSRCYVSSVRVLSARTGCCAKRSKVAASFWNYSTQAAAAASW